MPNSRKPSYTYYPAALCKDVLKKAPASFWESFDSETNGSSLESTRLKCPDIEGFELRYNILDL